LFAGICCANITVAQAYIADITPPENRSSKMGLIGMAFGVGFAFGPVFGAVSSKYFGVTAPGWTAAILCAINFISAFLWLGESWKPAEHTVIQRPHLEQWMHTLRAPRLNLLIGIYFLATFCFTCFEATIGLLVIRNFKIDIKSSLVTVSWLIAYCGVMGFLVQSPGAIGRVVRRLGEPKMIAASLVVAAIGIGVLPFMTTWAALLAGLGVFTIGSSLTRPPVFGMISMMTLSTEQGAVMGVTQGMGSLARILGPIFAATLFVAHASLPYLICAALCFATALVTSQYLTHVPVAAKT
jgi:MFS family permease